MNGFIKSVVSFMLLSPLILHAIPNESYKKYISYYIGLLFILVLIQPIGSLLNIEEWMNEKWKEYNITFDIDKMESLSINSVSNWTQEKILDYVKDTGKSYDLEVKSCEATIETDMTLASYGQVNKLQIQLSQNKEDFKVEQFKRSLSKTFSIGVEKIWIGKNY